MDLIDIYDSLKSKPGFKSNPNQSEETILKYETEIGVKFPQEYREFLKALGYVEWDGSGVFGISGDDYFNVAKCTKDAKSLKLPDEFKEIDTNAIVIHEYAGGGFYLLFGKGSEREGEVSLVLTETMHEEEESWGSFSAFLNDDCI